MSYKIYYYREKKKPANLAVPISIAVMLAALALTNVCYYFEGNVTQWSEYLLPWRRPEFKQAFSAFTEEMAEGRPISDCIEAFCIEIFYEPSKQP